MNPGSGRPASTSLTFGSIPSRWPTTPTLATGCTSTISILRRSPVRWASCCLGR